MPEKEPKTTRISLRSALNTARFIWPEFISVHGLVVLAKHSNVNPCPPSTTLSEWEAFVNHTHILDEFAIKDGVTERCQTSKHIEGNADSWDEWEMRYIETHPDFIAACELGRIAARLWTLKLCQDFPHERFRVYYTQYDNPIIRFHKVRTAEPVWLPDETLLSSTHSDFRNALIFDTHSLSSPDHGRSPAIQ